MSKFDNISFSKYADYSDILASAKNLDSIKSQVEIALMSTSLGGEPLTSGVYNIKNSSTGSDDATINELNIEAGIKLVGNDVEETLKLVSLINKKIEELTDKISENEKKIEELKEEIQRLTQELQSLDSSDPDNAPAIYSLNAQISMLSQQLEELEKETAGLKEDLEKLKTTMEEYTKMGTEKKEFYQKLTDISGALENAKQNLMNTFKNDNGTDGGGVSPSTAEANNAGMGGGSSSSGGVSLSDLKGYGSNISLADEQNKGSNTGGGGGGGGTGSLSNSLKNANKSSSKTSSVSDILNRLNERKEKKKDALATDITEQEEKKDDKVSSISTKPVQTIAPTTTLVGGGKTSSVSTTNVGKTSNEGIKEKTDTTPITVTSTKESNTSNNITSNKTSTNTPKQETPKVIVTEPDTDEESISALSVLTGIGLAGGIAYGTNKVIEKDKNKKKKKDEEPYLTIESYEKKLKEEEEKLLLENVNKNNKFKGGI